MNYSIIDNLRNTFTYTDKIIDINFITEKEHNIINFTLGDHRIAPRYTPRLKIKKINYSTDACFRSDEYQHMQHADVFVLAFDTVRALEQSSR